MQIKSFTATNESVEPDLSCTYIIIARHSKQIVKQNTYDI